MSFAVIASLALAAQGFGGGTQPGGLLEPLRDNAACITCHRDGTDANPEPGMAIDAYKGTMMNLAGVDPLYLAALEIAHVDNPESVTLCNRCHYPKAWLQGRGVNGTPQNFFGLEDNDLEGVTCDYCHRMDVPAPTNPQSTVPPGPLSGVLIGNAQAALKARADVKQGPHGSDYASGHSSEYSPLMEDSVLCATCHDVSNILLTLKDDDGTDTGIPMPLERTYTEWKSSAYPAEGKNCMSCHMKPYDGVAATAGPPPERELANHRLVGGQTDAPLMVSYLYADNPDAPPFLQDIEPYAANAASAAKSLLQEAAELEALALSIDETGRRLKIRVTNKAGHKLPTGYSEGRRMWIAHTVTDQNGAEVLKTGTPDPTTWNFVDGEAPTHIWEVQLAEDIDSGHSFHFVTVDKVLKDNRIPPRGFVPQTDTVPIGEDYPELEDGTLAPYSDVELPVDGSECWPIAVDLTLYFQPTSGDYYQFLKQNSPTFGPELEEAWLAIGGSTPTAMATRTVTLWPDGSVLAGRVTADQCYAPPPLPAPPVEPEPTPAPEGQPEPDVDYRDAQGGLCRCVSTTPRAALPGALALLAGAGLLVRRRRRA